MFVMCIVQMWMSAWIGMAAVTKVATTLRVASTASVMKGTHFMSMASSVRVSMNYPSFCCLLCALQGKNSIPCLNVNRHQ